MPDKNIDHPAVGKGAIAVAAATLEASFNVDHLYVDDDGNIRDSHIEDLFEDLFYGKPLDELFRNNFRQYVGLLTEAAVPETVFDNVTKMRQWVTLNFGTLELSLPCPVTMAAHPEFSHCVARAVFVEPKRFEIDASYGPSELNAGLLCVVSVLRQLAHKFNHERFTAKPSELN